MTSNLIFALFWFFGSIRVSVYNVGDVVVVVVFVVPSGSGIGVSFRCLLKVR